MKHNTILFALLLLICVGCAGSKLSEEARLRAKEVGQELITTSRDNEMAMQNVILKAKAIKSEYLIMGDTIAAQDFEEAYIEHIKEHDDSLATILF